MKFSAKAVHFWLGDPFLLKNDKFDIFVQSLLETTQNEWFLPGNKESGPKSSTFEVKIVKILNSKF